MSPEWMAREKGRMASRVEDSRRRLSYKRAHQVPSPSESSAINFAHFVNRMHLVCQHSLLLKSPLPLAIYKLTDQLLHFSSNCALTWLHLSLHPQIRAHIEASFSLKKRKRAKVLAPSLHPRSDQRSLLSFAIHSFNGIR